MIRKGEEVFIKPEWLDEGDEKYRRFALEDEDGGRVLIVADLGWRFNPTERIQTSMLITDQGESK